MKDLIRLLENRRSISEPWSESDLVARKYVRSFDRMKQIIIHDVPNLKKAEGEEWESRMENNFMPMIELFRVIHWESDDTVADGILPKSVDSLLPMKELLGFYAQGIGTAFMRKDTGETDPDFANMKAIPRVQKKNILSWELDNMGGYTSHITIELDFDMAVWYGGKGVESKFIRITYA